LLKQNLRATRIWLKKQHQFQSIKVTNNYAMDHPSISNNNDLDFKEKLKEIRAAGHKAEQEFKIKYAGINEWFAGDYDSLYLLSFCFRYFITSEQGQDEEAETGGISFPAHYQEILQAMALSHPRSGSFKPLAEGAEKLKYDMMEIGHLIKAKLQKLPKNIVDQKSLYQYQVRVNMMGYHLAVRNWAYHFQMLRVAQDMAGLIRKEFMTIYHVDPVDFITLLFTMSSAIETRLNDYLRKIMSALASDDYLEIQNGYQAAIGQEALSEQSKERLWEKSGRNLTELRVILLMHSDLFLPELFTWSIDEMIDLSKGETQASALAGLMDKLSFSFSDLKDFQQEHIVLDNPVHNKPFIRLSEQHFFSSLWMTIPHISLSLLEYLAQQDDKLKKRYETKKAQYLEDQTELLFKSSFPTAKVYRGSKYKGLESKDYENDLLVIIDSFALVVECKSGTVTNAAKRGAPDRLFKTLKELVEDPSEQALRFIRYLKDNRGLHSFKTDSTSDASHKNIVDTTRIDYFIPLGVTFYHLGLAGTNLKLLIDAAVTDKKINELAPSISLTDLEIIFATLKTDATKIHYLHRRREFETQVKYIADELDLLGFYLDNGFNIGNKENDPGWIFNLILQSKKLDPYFTGRRENSSIEIASLKIIPWWKDILGQLATKKPKNWLDFSYILLNMNDDDQMQLENLVKELTLSILNGTAQQEHNWVVYRTANRNRQYSFAVYPYLNKHRDMRDEMIQEILDQEYEQNPAIKGSVVIGVNIEKKHYPYSVGFPFLERP
jgi:hypothetical protein